MVVLVAPVFDEEASFCQRAEPMLVEAVVTEGAVEAFDEGVLSGFARLDVVDGDTRGLSPEMKGAAGKFGTVVGGDRGGQAAGGCQLLEDGDDGAAADGSIDMKSQALTSEVIDQSQRAEAAAVGELVMDEVHAPALVGSGWLRQRHACESGQLPAAFAAQREALLAVKTLGALVILDETLGLEDIVQDGRTPAWLESGPMAEALPQSRIVMRCGLILERGAVPAGEAAEAALGKPKA